MDAVALVFLVVVAGGTYCVFWALAEIGRAVHQSLPQKSTHDEREHRTS